MKPSYRSAVIFAALLLLAAGCIPTEKPLLEPEQPQELVASAIIRTELDVGPDKILIKRIDDRAAPILDYRWVVSPGSHEVEVEADLPEPTQPGYRTKVTRVLTVDVAAGGEYFVEATSDADGIWMWIVDRSTGEVIAGESPPSGSR